MAVREPEEDGQMTESQRISILERSMSTNRIFLLLLAVLIIVTLSVSITIAILSTLEGDAESASAGEIIELRAEVKELKAELLKSQAQVASLNESIPQLRTALQNSSAPTFQRLLLQQEESYQEFLKGLKEGMYDLARMVPGSRTWLELYSERMDKATTLSQDRERQLKRLNTGEPLIEP
ncbi:hypothetical protein [Hahella ganghwensis]|uniref:hypothetical protein n=1 Tax=Hahella ganghwensis TaxID=286420 RepID=UPI0003675AC8|nr:hypothetical protein [Hahella ganghwensis]